MQDFSDLRRVVCALVTALLLAIVALDIADASNPLPLTSGSALAIIEDGEDLKDHTSALLRSLNSFTLDGAALEAEYNQLSAAPKLAFSRIISLLAPAFFLSWHRPQTSTGPPGHLQAV